MCSSDLPLVGTADSQHLLAGPESVTMEEIDEAFSELEQRSREDPVTLLDPSLTGEIEWTAEVATSATILLPPWHLPGKCQPRKNRGGRIWQMYSYIWDLTEYFHQYTCTLAPL